VQEKIVYRNYKFRLYPNKDQEEHLGFVLEQSRRAYNKIIIISRRIHTRFKYKNEKVWLKKTDKVYFTKKVARKYMQLFRCNNEDMQKISSAVLDDTIDRVLDAYKRFFKNIKKGEKGSPPRIKKWEDFNSFLYNYSKRFTLNGNRLKLQKFQVVGDIKVKLHRPIEGEIKTCRILREINKWYCILSVKKVIKVPLKVKIKKDRMVGLDLGVNRLIALSNGYEIKPKESHERAFKRVQKYQKDLSRKVKGGANYYRTLKKHKKAWIKLSNMRGDFHHKNSLLLAKNYDLIVGEDIAIKKITSSKKGTVESPGVGVKYKSRLNKKILDMGWGKLFNHIEYKIEERGGKFEKVNPVNTSQLCSGCNEMVRKEAGEDHDCQHCGLKLNRDHNAAINILNKHLNKQITVGKTD
tara:strand:- start:1459 stop:2685 length:1227 start_codon:yes stop_codon:yes gene_type:complete